MVLSTGHLDRRPWKELSIMMKKKYSTDFCIRVHDLDKPDQWIVAICRHTSFLPVIRRMTQDHRTG